MSLRDLEEVEAISCFKEEIAHLHCTPFACTCVAGTGGPGPPPERGETAKRSAVQVSSLCSSQ